MGAVEKPALLLQKTALSLVCGIIITIPLLFGAVHPLVSGIYVCVMLVGCGGWLLLTMQPGTSSFFSPWSLVPILLIAYVALQAIPLPVELVESLSPARAGRMQMLNTLAGTDLQSITISDNGSAGFFRAFFLFALLLYFFSLKRLFSRTPDALYVVFICLVSVGIFEAFYGIVQFLKPQIGILWLPLKFRAASGTIIYKNQYASLINMLWPLAIAGFAVYFSLLDNRERKKSVFTSITKTKSVLFFAAAVLIVLAVVFSLSRGGILAMSLVSLLLIVLLPFSRKKKLLFVSLFIVLIIGYGSLLGLDTIISRFDSIDKSGENRLDVYLLSLPMVFDHWLTGIGMGSYTLLSPLYLKGFGVNLHWDRVHSEYLELLIELGIPMAALFFGWIFIGLAAMLRALLSSRRFHGADKGKTILGIAAWCGLVGFLMHGFVDFGWRLPANLLYAVTLAAIIGACMKQPAQGERTRRIRQEVRRKEDDTAFPGEKLRVDEIVIE